MNSLKVAPMMPELHPVTLRLQPVFDAAPLDAVAVELCKQAVDDYLKKTILFESESFIEVLNTLYALNDNKLYSILKIENGSDCTYFLMPNRQGLRDNAVYAPSCYLKNSELYQREILLGELLKVKALAGDICVSVTKTFTYMSRRATGIKEEVEVQYPSLEELKLFYECKRKVAYNSADAVIAELDEGKSAYLCPHCNHYHQGASPRQAEEVTDMTRLKRYKRVWRMRHNLGEFRHQRNRYQR